MRSAEHFPDHRDSARSVTGRCAAVAPRLHPAAGLPARRTARPEADPRRAARWHSASRPPGSGSFPPAAPAQPPSSAPPALPHRRPHPGLAAPRRRQSEARRFAGTRDPNSSSSERARGDPAGCTTAVPWKLMVAGGMGATSDKIPPRRTGTVTATRPSAAMCRASSCPARPRRPAADRWPCIRRRWTGVPGRRDMSQHGERCPGDHPPHFLAGQQGLWLPVLFMDSPGSHDRASRCKCRGPPRLTLPPGGHLARE